MVAIKALENLPIRSKKIVCSGVTRLFFFGGGGDILQTLESLRCNHSRTKNVFDDALLVVMILFTSSPDKRARRAKKTLPCV